MSPALLESIFYPGNLLHDGAVLIRENKVVSAANVLPLTKTVISGKKLGTRHRAAIGLSEQSDALILVGQSRPGKFPLPSKESSIRLVRPRPFHE